jgi:uracil phosphoribosyltransferase
VLATGNTATGAIDRVKERGAKEIRFVCLIAAQQGVERVRGLHPDVRLWTAAIDDRLDERGFIVPGLGDAGDSRLRHKIDAAPTGRSRAAYDWP